MKQSEAIKILSSWDKHGRHVYLKRDLGVILGEKGRLLDQTLHRLVRSDILERVAHGVYVFKYSRHVGADTIEHIARNLRRGDIVFESLESALSQYGVISQVPIDRITLMTTGRSGEYKTPYGVIEFTHTKESVDQILPNIRQREGHPLPIATKHYAYRNLRSTKRNLTMIDEEALYEEN